MAEKKSILEILKQYIEDQENFPVLNPDAARLQNEILKQEPDLDAVKKLIQTDPTLTGEILKVANSSYYQGLGEVATIKEAVLRLGRDELVNIIMQVLLKKNFTSALPAVKARQVRLWNHSVACAFAARWLVRHLNMETMLSKAFIAGLLHDIGKLCLLSAIEKIMSSKTDKVPLTPELMERILDSLHEEQGYALLTQWNLPEQYCRIAREHHTEKYDESDNLLAVVRLADMVTNKMSRNDPGEDLAFIMGSKEADILGIRETGVALLEIALEDAGLASKTA
ncbi:MAG: HDOD domain-containing protein [Desulfobacter sp.]|nr:MAG: HDOD domain-containing protein [Desulfobacter sp.]